MNVIGEVEGRTCVIMDDMVDTAGTLVKAAAGAEGATAPNKVVAYCTHAVLSGPAVERIAKSDARRAGGHRHHSAARGRAQPARRSGSLSVAGLLAETILRIYTEESVSSLFIE